jgi:hypothetical protein
MSELICERCKQPLTPDTCVWLELNARTGKYGPIGSVSPEQSQGEFPFGRDCAQHPNRELPR